MRLPALRAFPLTAVRLPLRYVAVLNERSVGLHAVGGILFAPFLWMVALTVVASVSASRAAKLLKALRSTRAAAV